MNTIECIYSIGMNESIISSFVLKISLVVVYRRTVRRFLNQNVFQKNSYVSTLCKII